MYARRARTSIRTRRVVVRGGTPLSFSGVRTCGIWNLHTGVAGLQDSPGDTARRYVPMWTRYTSRRTLGRITGSGRHSERATYVSTRSVVNRYRPHTSRRTSVFRPQTYVLLYVRTFRYVSRAAARPRRGHGSAGSALRKRAAGASSYNESTDANNIDVDCNSC